jgi:hypothetical protein
MVNEEPSQIPQDMTIYNQKFFQQASQINMNTQNQSKMRVDNEFGRMNGTFKKRLNENDHYTKLHTINSENLIYSPKLDSNRFSSNVFTFEQDKTPYGSNVKINTSGHSKQSQNTYNGNSLKIIDGAFSNSKFYSRKSTVKNMPFQFDAEKLPFPPVPPDFPILILKFVKSEILTNKKEPYLPEKEFLLESGAYYRGELRYGKMHGKGRIYLQNVDLTDGTMAQEKPYLMFDGEFQNNEIQGQGVLYFSGGEKFVGSFQNGLAHGIGKYYMSNGRIVCQGSWVEGKYYA